MIQVRGGLHYPAEGDELERLASTVEAGHAIVEIGSYVGASTLRLAAGASYVSGVHVTCIDPWPDPQPDEQDKDHARRQRAALPTFLLNMGMADWPVTALRAKSSDVLPMWLQPIGLLFIDGNHELGEVLNDLQWHKHIAPGGILALHDYLDAPLGYETDVAKALKLKALDRDLFHQIGQVETMWIGQRRT